jgi:hypothetical protein
MAETLSPDDVGLQLFENAAAGIAPESAPMFVATQTIEALIAFALFNPLFHQYRDN